MVVISSFLVALLAIGAVNAHAQPKVPSDQVKTAASVSAITVVSDTQQQQQLQQQMSLQQGQAQGHSQGHSQDHPFGQGPPHPPTGQQHQGQSLHEEHHLHPQSVGRQGRVGISDLFAPLRGMFGGGRPRGPPPNGHQQHPFPPKHHVKPSASENHGFSKPNSNGAHAQTPFSAMQEHMRSPFPSSSNFNEVGFNGGEMKAQGPGQGQGQGQGHGPPPPKHHPGHHRQPHSFPMNGHGHGPRGNGPPPPPPPMSMPPLPNDLGRENFNGNVNDLENGPPHSGSQGQGQVQGMPEFGQPPKVYHSYSEPQLTHHHYHTFQGQSNEGQGQPGGQGTDNGSPFGGNGGPQETREGDFDFSQLDGQQSSQQFSGPNGPLPAQGQRPNVDLQNNKDSSNNGNGPTFEGPQFVEFGAPEDYREQYEQQTRQVRQPEMTFGNIGQGQGQGQDNGQYGGPPRGQFSAQFNGEMMNDEGFYSPSGPSNEREGGQGQGQGHGRPPHNGPQFNQEQESRQQQSFSYRPVSGTIRFQGASGGSSAGAGAANNELIYGKPMLMSASDSNLNTQDSKNVKGQTQIHGEGHFEGQGQNHYSTAPANSAAESSMVHNTLPSRSHKGQRSRGKSSRAPLPFKPSQPLPQPLPFEKPKEIQALDSPKDPHYAMKSASFHSATVVDPEAAATGYYGDHHHDHHGFGHHGHGLESSSNGDRILYHVSGHQGPYSYRFGYDTGKGYNRQFRHEEKDGKGYVHGKYGFYDKYGKLNVVSYQAHPEKGYHAARDGGHHGGHQSHHIGHHGHGHHGHRKR